MVRALWLPIGLSLAIAGPFFAAKGSAAAAPPLLSEVQVVPLPGVERRIDHMAVAPASQWLLVSALGNHTLEVVDSAKGERLATVRNIDEPQGVAFVPPGKVVVAARGGTVAAITSDYDPAGRASFKAYAAVATTMDDADNVRLDKASGLAYVGYGEGALGVIDPTSMTKTADIPLPGHPESFQLEQAGPRIYVNVPRTHEVVVVDRASRSIVAHFPLGGLTSNYPMSLDEAGHRLFVGVRQPARLVVLDTASGKQLAVVPCVGDTDDLFFDARRQRVYVIGGEGYVDVFDATASGSYARLARITTRAGARTGLFSPDLDRLYIAWPAREGHVAEIETLAP